MTPSIHVWLKLIAINVLVVTCDLKKLPNVEDANAVIKPETGELMLPGNFLVTYACNEWNWRNANTICSLGRDYLLMTMMPS